MSLTCPCKMDDARSGRPRALVPSAGKRKADVCCQRLPRNRGRVADRHGPTVPRSRPARTLRDAVGTLANPPLTRSRVLSGHVRSLAAAGLGRTSINAPACWWPRPSVGSLRRSTSFFVRWRCQHRLAQGVRECAGRFSFALASGQYPRPATSPFRRIASRQG